jgi:hypothetical protein
MSASTKVAEFTREVAIFVSKRFSLIYEIQFQAE